MSTATDTTDTTDLALDPVVQRSCNAYHRAYSAEREKGVGDYEASEKGAEAYRNAMPCLTTYANIRDFIACVTYGMLCHVIRNDDATKLLYASQVALGALRAQPKPDQPKNDQPENNQPKPDQPKPS